MPGLWKGARNTPKRRRDVIGMSSLHHILAAASPKRKCDRLFKVTSPAAHTHLTRAQCHGLLARSAATNICSMAAVLAHCSLLSSNPSFVARTRVLGLS